MIENFEEFTASEWAKYPNVSCLSNYKQPLIFQNDKLNIVIGGAGIIKHMPYVTICITVLNPFKLYMFDLDERYMNSVVKTIIDMVYNDTDLDNYINQIKEK